MSLPFWRAGLVDISDAELKVLDVFADYGALHFKQLSGPEFDQRFNRDPHQLDDHTLASLLERWRHSGWLRVVPCYRGDGHELTAMGGAQWESERQPDWSRLVCARSGDLSGRSERRIDTYFGATASVVEASFQTYVEIEHASVLRLRRATVRRQRWAYAWKSLTPISVISAVVANDDPESRYGRDWAHYERTRCWWRNTSEIMKSRAQPP